MPDNSKQESFLTPVERHFFKELERYRHNVLYCCAALFVSSLLLTVSAVIGLFK